jgi:hypothetical protein
MVLHGYELVQLFRSAECCARANCQANIEDAPEIMAYRI